MIFGYARVSTLGQTLDAQCAALREAGAEKVFTEKVSGAHADRPQLLRLLAGLEHGDTLVVTRLDRLARSTLDLLNILDAVGKAGSSFRSLAETWADTATPHGKLLITVLGGVAEFERSLIATRTTEGRIRAKAEGKRMGRRPALTEHQRAEALDALRQGVKGVDLARRYNVHESTISRLAATLCDNTRWPRFP